MGCARSNGIQVIVSRRKSESQDSKENLFAIKSILEKKESRSKSVSAKAFRLDTNEDVENISNLKSSTEKIISNCEIGKEGEDNEANIIEEGIKKMKIIDLHIPKIRLPKKLPPIQRDKFFSQSTGRSHRPDFSIINSLLSKEKDKDFQNLNLDENDEKSIIKIMEESFKRGFDD